MKFHYGPEATTEFQQRMRFLKDSRLYWCAVMVEWTFTQPAPWVADNNLAVLISQQLNKTLAQEQEKAFLLCLPSGDMLMMGEGLSNAAYQRVKTALQSILIELGAQVLDTECKTYDLSVDWDAFLAACREIYSRLGKLQEKSQIPEKESLLQRLEADLAQARLGSHADKPTKLNLLFVEDEPTIRQLLNNLLGEMPHNLSFAANGTEAIAAYIRKPPHIVFLDINLPDISGLEVLELIMKHDKNTHAVMLTSSAAQAQVQSAVQRGVKGYIVKPFSRQKLIECIDRYYAL